MKSTKINSLFPKRGNRNAKRTEKHKNKTTQGKTQNKSSRRTNHKATKGKTNTGTTALERPVEQTTGGPKAPAQLANPTPGPDVTINTEMHNNATTNAWTKMTNSGTAFDRSLGKLLWCIYRLSRYKIQVRTDLLAKVFSNKHYVWNGGDKT